MDDIGPRRLGAYVLPGDPVWLRSSLSRYYDILDDLVVPVPSNGLGWTGRPIPVEQTVAVIEEIDVRGIARTIEGEWVSEHEPIRAETIQRTAALEALGGSVDWVLTLDNDEVIPDANRLIEMIPELEDHHLDGLEWPLRVLYRHLGGDRYLQVANDDGSDHFEYAGCVLVRPGVTLSEARHIDGPYGRVIVDGDDASLQVTRPAGAGEHRFAGLGADAAIWHNSWGRPAADIRRKITTWGHSDGMRSQRYYWTTWWPSPMTWRVARDLHPFSRGLWPRLCPVTLPATLLAASDRSHS